MADELNTRVNMTVQGAQVMTVPIDTTLSIQGQAADAKAVGDALADKADRSELSNQITVNGQAPDAQGLILISADDVPITDEDPTRLSAVLEEMQEDIDGKTAEDIPVAPGESKTVAEALQEVASATTADHIQLTAEDPTTVKTALDGKLTADDIDTELETAGKAADALATGNAIREVDEAAVKSVNGILPDADGDVAVTEVENARQIVSSRNISTTGSFVVRPTSGHGSVSDGTATLRRIVGNSVHTGYVPEVLTVLVEAAARPVPAAITGEIDAATFEAYVITAGTYTTSYDGTSWSVDPALYGITLAGTPIDGDSITVVWDGENDPVMTISAAQREPAPEITATIDKDTFRGYVTQDAVIDLYYTSEWSADPTLYGLTIVGDPIPGDHIRITYVKLDRGVITSANPVRVVGTGWNLFRLADGWARVCRYSEVYGYRIGGTYATVAFAETLDGEQTTITPDANGLFNVTGDGYLLIGGGSSDTYVYTTWSDWIESAPEYEAYTESAVNLAAVMADFAGGLCSVGDVADEIDFDRQIAISRIQRMTLTAENLAAAEASGRAWDADREWIYLVRAAAVETRISVEPSYTVSEHGLEILEGSTVPAWVEAMYGTNLRDKLERDVVTVSAQELTEPQKAQVRSNIGAGSAADVASLNDNITKLQAADVVLQRHTRLTDFNLADLQASAADQNLAKHGLKPGDQKTINGYTYVIAGPNVMKGTHGYTCTGDHIGLIVIPHTTHAWNASGRTDYTSTGSDNRGGGYKNCDLHQYLKTDVLNHCKADLGADHLYAHQKLLGSAVNPSGYNRFGTNSGCTSSWAWEECYISALTESQVYGGIRWSSSGYDTGEANTILPVFAAYKHTEIFGSEYPWLRDVSSASQACHADNDGHAHGDYSVGNAYYVAGLILYH